MRWNESGTKVAFDFQVVSGRWAEYGQAPWREAVVRAGPLAGQFSGVQPIPTVGCVRRVLDFLDPSAGRAATRIGWSWSKASGALLVAVGKAEV